MRNKWESILVIMIIAGILCTAMKNSVSILSAKKNYAEAADSTKIEDGDKLRLETKGESESESESETENEGETESDLEGETVSETLEESHNESRSDMELNSDTECDTEKKSDTETECDTKMESDTESECTTEIEIDTETECSTEMESDTESKSDTEVESDTELESDIELESETESDTETETDTISQSEFAEQTEEVIQSEPAEQTEAPLQSESAEQTEAPVQSESVEQTGAPLQSESVKQTEEASQSESVSQSDPLQSETVKQTEAPASVVRGTDYEISGDSNAWYRDENGMLWVRAGTSLYVQPKSGSGYNTGMSLANLQSDGVFTFTLSKKKKDNTVVKESASGQESYYVDWEAPSARFTISGNSKDAIHYASQSCSVSVAVEPDGKSGLKSTAYKIIPCDAGGSVAKSVEGVAWTECVSNAALQISEEGLFRIYIKTEDMVGNIAFSSSDVICVDNTQPEITVTGADNQTANAGSVSLKVRCSDNHYKAGSMQVTITGVNQGNIPAVRQEGSDEMGAWVEYHDFPQMQSYDDVYELSVTAEDLSGNTSEKTICFSVNRFGSVYDLSSETKKLLEQYFIPEAGDVVFYETNIDYVGESRIYCRHDGVLRELTDGTDYQVTMEGSETSWKRYRYTVPASYFSQEGVYELLLASGDAAENTSDTGVQQKRVTFVLDWTSPSCMVSGVEDGGVYDEESVMLCVVPYDNIGLSCLRIYRNSELFLENAGQPVSGEAVKLSLESDSEWQTLQIWLIDMAGNEYWSEEMPVFVGAAGIDVPVYRKVRKSAMELTLDAESADGEKIPGEDESAELLDAEIAGAGDEGINKLADSVDPLTGEQQEDEDQVKDKADSRSVKMQRTLSENTEVLNDRRDKFVGKMFLFVGIAVFAGTVFLAAGLRRKRFK